MDKEEPYLTICSTDLLICSDMLREAFDSIAYTVEEKYAITRVCIYLDQTARAIGDTPIKMKVLTDRWDTGVK